MMLDVWNKIPWTNLATRLATSLEEPVIFLSFERLPGRGQTYSWWHYLWLEGVPALWLKGFNLFPSHKFMFNVSFSCFPRKNRILHKKISESSDSKQARAIIQSHITSTGSTFTTQNEHLQFTKALKYVAKQDWGLGSIAHIPPTPLPSAALDNTY